VLGNRKRTGEGSGGIGARQKSINPMQEKQRPQLPGNT
jgi:hypothetical protein